MVYRKCTIIYITCVVSSKVLLLDCLQNHFLLLFLLFLSSLLLKRSVVLFSVFSFPYTVKSRNSQIMKWMKLVQFAITSYLRILFYFKKTCPGMYRSQVPERHFLCIRKRKNEDFVFIYILSSCSYQHNTAKTEGSA